MNAADLKTTAETFARALAAIGSVVAGATKSGISPKALAAADALQVIGAIVQTIEHALGAGTKTLSPKEARVALDRLLNKLDANDAATDAAIAKKFKK